MKLKEALKIIDKKETTGYMVGFEEVVGGMLESDYFPDKHDGEELIATENEAWELARKFAEKTKGKYVNIYVIDKNFNPVQGYSEKLIRDFELRNNKRRIMAKQAIATKEQTDVMTPDNITKEDVKNLICPTATDKEIVIFLQVAKLNQLNFLKREIYLIKYGSQPATTVTGYEVYLKRAERSGNYAGFKVWVEGEGSGMKACIDVYRKDWTKPLYHEVDYSEYVGKKYDGSVTKFWLKMPKTMLKKVAISQGLRFAFPDELSGMPYTSAEITDIDVVDVAPAKQAKPVIREPQEKAPDKPTVAPEAIKQPEPAVSPKEPVKPAQNQSSNEKPMSQRFAEAIKKIGKTKSDEVLKNHSLITCKDIKSKEVMLSVLADLELLAGVEEVFDGEDLGIV